MPAVGLDISDQFVRVVEFARAPHGRFTIKKYAERQIPEGVVTDGFIYNPGELTKILRALRADLGFKFVRASLPEEKAYLFTTDVPAIASGDMRSAVEFKIQENVPISPSKSVFDYSVIVRDERSSKVEVAIAVLPIKVVSAYSDVFHASGITPVAFKIESQAIARAVVPTGDMTPTIIINLDGKKTGFFVVSKGIVQFSSTMHISAESLTSLIQKQFKVSFEEAVRIKRRRGFEKSKESTELFYSLVNTFSAIRDEVSKLTNYWEKFTTKFGSEERIQKIILCGEDAMLGGIGTYLSMSMPIKVDVANVWTNALDLEHYVPPIDQVSSLNYAAAVGLAFPEA